MQIAPPTPTLYTHQRMEKNMTKSTILHIRLSPDHKDKLTRLSKDSGVSMTEWIENAIDGVGTKPITLEDRVEHLEQLLGM